MKAGVRSSLFAVLGIATLALGACDNKSDDPRTVAAPTFSPAAGTFDTAQNVILSSATLGATIRFTTDGSTPSTTNGTVYSAPIPVAATTTISAYATMAGMTDSAVVSATYTIGVAPTQVAAPTFSPTAGTYTGTQLVTLATDTPDASIRYTTDDTDPSPTEGTLYTDPISVAASTTIKAIAYKAEMTDSTVVTAAYVIQTPSALKIEGATGHNTGSGEHGLTVHFTIPETDLTVGDWTVSFDYYKPTATPDTQYTTRQIQFGLGEAPWTAVYFQKYDGWSDTWRTVTYDLNDAPSSGTKFAGAKAFNIALPYDTAVNPDGTAVVWYLRNIVITNGAGLTPLDLQVTTGTDPSVASIITGTGTVTIGMP